MLSTRRNASGFTLFELVVAMAITAILVTIAIPSFSGLTAEERAKSASSELFESLLRTRSSAIKRDTNVSLTPDGGVWANGWEIVDPTNAANALDTHGPTAGVTITGPSSVTYRDSGRLQAGTEPVFVVSASGGGATYDLCISIDLTGRPYAATGTTC